MTEENKIRDVITAYVDGTYEGSREKLASCFHDKAVMNGYLAGDLMLATPEVFIDNMEKNPIKNTDSDYRSEIVNLEIEDKVAMVTLKEAGFPGGLGFTNYFHLIDDGNGWKIVSKLFQSS